MTTAERLDELTAIHEVAVVRAAGDRIEVQAAGGVYQARRAVSCLVEPEEGDLVLLAVTPAGRAWVLSILEREAEGGRVRLRAEELELEAKRELKLTAPRLAFTSFDLRAAVERLVLAGGSAHVSLQSAKAVITLADRVFERLTTNAKRVYRYVEELDLTRARQIEMRAETTAHVRSKQTFMTSDDLVKVEADQIHLG